MNFSCMARQTTFAIFLGWMLLMNPSPQLVRADEGSENPPSLRGGRPQAGGGTNAALPGAGRVPGPTGDCPGATDVSTIHESVWFFRLTSGRLRKRRGGAAEGIMAMLRSTSQEEVVVVVVGWWW